MEFNINLTRGELDILIHDMTEQVLKSYEYDGYHKELYKNLLEKLKETKNNS